MTKDPKLNARIAATVALAKRDNAAHRLAVQSARQCTQGVGRMRRRTREACHDALRAELEAQNA